MGIENFIRNKICRMDAIYWKRQNTTDGYGRYLYDAPIEIKTRWTDKQKLVMQSNGEQLLASSEIMVTFDMKELDYLFLGNFDDLAYLVDSDEFMNPENIPGARQIKVYTKTPDFKCRDFVRFVYLG